MRTMLACVLGTATSAVIVIGASAAEEERLTAKQILDATGVRGGLVVHLGCGDPPAGGLTAALRAGDGYMVHGLDTDTAKVRKAREHIQSLGLYGSVSVEVFDGDRLPYIDNLVNLVVASGEWQVPNEEVLRVLTPGGVALMPAISDRQSAISGERIRIDGNAWSKVTKPVPAEIDEWTHYLHGPGNNAVAHDTVVGPPRRMQWVGSPRYSRHHDHMSSLSAVVSAGGRVFYIFDEATPVSVLAPSKWALIARDAFNGTILWKRSIDKWHTHLWKLKSGPAQLPRRLVASGDRVYVTLGLDEPLAALDAATGETLRTYDGTKATEEVILSQGILFALVNDAEEKPDYDGRKRFRGSYNAKFWDEAKRKIKAVRPDMGEILWTTERRVLPTTLAADAKRVAFHDGQCVVCLDRTTGNEIWRSEAIARSEEIRGFYAPILVLYEDVVLFSGGETAGKQTGSWYESGEDTMTALDAATGKVLWSAHHPPSGYRSPEDLLVVDGLVWTGETTSGRAEGVFTGRDPRTGEVKREFPPDVSTYWFHHRCYRGKATDNFLLMSRTGIEFLDVRKKQWIPHHWVRGACSYGVMPANGLVYAPQHPCACYLEAKMYGFNALAPARESKSRRVEKSKSDQELRLDRGPAYSEVRNQKAEGRGKERASSRAAGNLNSDLRPLTSGEDWPTYRHDAARSGRASTSVPAALERAWQADIGGRLTSPVIAGGKVFVASVDAHTLHAIDAATGRQVWEHTVGGRVDSPPTIYQGLALFGCADGCVYALRAADGQLAWRFLAAPMDQRLMAFEQVESVWPVPGSVLVQDDVLYCVAGRSMFLDGGLRLWRLEPKTGRVLSETVLDDGDSKSNQGLQSYVSWLNMPTGLPDILSCDARFVYMRSQPFKLDGARLPLKAMPSGPDADRGAPPATQRADVAHLFSPTGFLDDTWWHRTYWMYGSRFVSGWCGYFRAGKATPSGRILVFDESKIYGFGRQPKYYRWTTPIEHHLFAADKTPPPASQSPGERPGEGDYLVDLHWAKDLPLFARAIVLADGTLFVAGPPDLINEDEAFKRIDAPEVQTRISDQVDALEGKQGALLWAVSANDGEKLAECQLDAPPVFDGMAAARGGLYFSTTDGKLVCMAGR